MPEDSVKDGNFCTRDPAQPSNELVLEFPCTRDQSGVSRNNFSETRDPLHRERESQREREREREREQSRVEQSRPDVRPDQRRPAQSIPVQAA